MQSPSERLNRALRDIASRGPRPPVQRRVDANTMARRDPHSPEAIRARRSYDLRLVPAAAGCWAAVAGQLLIRGPHLVIALALATLAMLGVLLLSRLLSWSVPSGRTAEAVPVNFLGRWGLPSLIQRRFMPRRAILRRVVLQCVVAGFSATLAGAGAYHHTRAVDRHPVLHHTQFRGFATVEGSPRQLAGGGLMVEVSLHGSATQPTERHGPRAEPQTQAEREPLGPVTLFVTERFATASYAVPIDQLQRGVQLDIAARIEPARNPGLVPITLNATRGLRRPGDSPPDERAQRGGVGEEHTPTAEASERPRGAWGRVAARIRVGLVEAAMRLPGEGKQIIPGMVIGDVRHQSPQLRQDFVATGLSHLTAVSGANVAIVTSSVLVLAVAAGAGRRASLALAGLALLAFVGIVGTEPSVLRAGVMGLVGVAAVASARWKDLFASISLAVIVLVICWPGMALKYGFALSVAATVGIAWIAPGMSRWVLQRYRQYTRRRWDRDPILAEAMTVRLLCVSLVADAVTSPIIMLMTGRFSPVTVLANLAVAWAVPVVTVVGFLALPLCALASALGAGWLGSLVLWPTVLPAEWITFVAGSLARVPALVTPGGWGWAAAWLVLLGLLGASIFWRRARRGLWWGWLLCGWALVIAESLGVLRPAVGESVEFTTVAEQSARAGSRGGFGSAPSHEEPGWDPPRELRLAGYEVLRFPDDATAEAYARRSPPVPDNTLVLIEDCGRSQGRPSYLPFPDGFAAPVVYPCADGVDLR